MPIVKERRRKKPKHKTKKAEQLSNEQSEHVNENISNNTIDHNTVKPSSPSFIERQYDAKKTMNLSYEDVEGMLLNLGVLSALVLSFVIGTIATVPLEEWNVADYKNNFIRFQAFRHYVHRHLSSENYNFQFDIGNPDGSLFDIEPILLETLDDDDQLIVNEGSIWPTDLVYDDRAKNLDLAAALTVDDFPPQLTHAYSIYQRGIVRSTRVLGGRQSISYVSLFFSLIGTILLYLVLSLSSARERADEGHFAVVKRFNRCGIPLLVILFALLLVGIVVFFMALSELVEARAPSWKAVVWLKSTLIFVVVPGLMVMFSGSLVLLSYVERKWCCKYRCATKKRRKNRIHEKEDVEIVSDRSAVNIDDNPYDDLDGENDSDG